MKKYIGPDNDSKLKILEAATSLFASKGFEGARIDEIAAKADINKAQIYYYFESKEAILEEIFERFMKKIDEKLKLAAQRFSGEIGAFNGPSHGDSSFMPLMDLLIEDFISFVEAEHDVIAICMMEGAKDTTGKGPVYAFFDRLIRAELNMLGQDRVQTQGMRRFVVHEFFTALIPIAAYSVFGKGIASRFGLVEEELKRLFKESLVLSHGGSTQAIIKLVADEGLSRA